MSSKQHYLEYIREFVNAGLVDLAEDTLDIKTILSNLLNQILDSSVDPLNVKALQSIMSSTVFMAMNTTAIDKSSEKRNFTSVIKWDKGAPQKTFIDLKPLWKDLPTILDRHDSLAVVNYGIGEDNIEYGQKDLNNFWYRRWEQYSQISEYTTWINFLMKVANKPQPIGICWGNYEPDKVSDSYILLNELDPLFNGETGLIPPIYSKEDFRDWLLTQTEPPCIPLNEEIHSPAVDRLYERWIEMGMRNNKKQPLTKQSCANAILALLWGYRSWGGTSLLAIPVVIGLDKEIPNVGVAFISTKKPLTDEQITTWKEVTYAIQSSVFIHLSVKQHNLNNQQFAYRIAHPLKSKANALASSMVSIKKLVRTLPEAKPNNGSSSETIQHILRYINDAINKTNRAASYGTVVNGLSALSNIKRMKDDAVGRYLQDESTSLKQRLKESLDNYRYDLTWDKDAFSALPEMWLSPYIDYFDHLKNPIDDVILLVFDELLGNAEKHGLVQEDLDDKCHVNIRVEYTDDKKPMWSIYISNMVQTKKRDILEDYEKCAGERSGGESLVVHILNVLNLGALYYTFDKCGKNKFAHCYKLDIHQPLKETESSYEL